MKKSFAIIALVLSFLANVAFAQTPPVASDQMGAAAADSMVKKWTERDKFTVFWLLNTGYSQNWTALPKEGKFRFNSRDYCEAVPADATYGVEEGKFVITITQPRPGCHVLKLKFDLATQEGILEVMEGGKFNHLSGRTVSLKD